MTNLDLQQLTQEKRLLLREMKERGIPRRSFMNGGHSDVSYRYNVELFRINCAIARIKEFGR